MTGTYADRHGELRKIHQMEKLVREVSMQDYLISTKMHAFPCGKVWKFTHHGRALVLEGAGIWGNVFKNYVLKFSIPLFSITLLSTSNVGFLIHCQSEVKRIRRLIKLVKTCSKIKLC